MNRRRSFDKKSPVVATPPVEQALIEAAEDVPGTQIFTTTVGRAQLAKAIAKQRRDAVVQCLVLDAYLAEQTFEQVGTMNSLEILCMADWPDNLCDLALLPFEARGQEELARDLMQGAFDKLKIGGRMMIAVPRRSEAWARDVLKPFSKKIKATIHGQAIVCSIIKDSPIKRLRDYSSESVFRDQERLVRLITRPGVFAHRKLDLGARQLLKNIELPRPGVRILDLGCGSGAVALGLAARDATATVVAVDSNPRAIDCTIRGRELNQLKNVQTILHHDNKLKLPDRVDIVAANPPYYSQYKIAEIFCENASRNLADGGKVYFVAKNSEWYEENMSRWFGDLDVIPSGGYLIIVGSKVTSATPT